MRMSCNGCRALRKGCSENCSIRPCLQWIPTAQSQASATLFLVKFYGRTCLINLINAGTQNLRPGIFKSLLYEACGRIVNPVHGSAGLILSGDWHLCEAAVEAVLSGEPIGQVSYDCKALGLSFKSSYDIRHVTKLENNSNKVGRIKAGGVFKRSKKEKTKADEEEENCYGGDGDAVSVETVEDSTVKTGELELELSLGVGTRPRKRRNNINGCDDAMCKPAQG